MPNYKRIVPRTPDPSKIGVVRMFLNAEGNLVVEYASGNIQVLTTSGTGPAPTTVIDGDFAINTQTVVRDGGDAGSIGTNDINSGGAFNTL